MARSDTQVLELHVAWDDATPAGTPTTDGADVLVCGHHLGARLWELAEELADGRPIQAVWIEPQLLTRSWNCRVCGTRCFRKGGR